MALFYNALLRCFGDKDLTVYLTQTAKQPPKLESGEFFMSFYYLPERLIKGITFHSTNLDYLNFESSDVGLLDFYREQRLYCYLTDEEQAKIPVHYIQYRDDNDRLFALQNENKLWVFVNLLNRNNGAIELFVKALKHYNPNLLECKPSTKEQKEKREKQRANLMLKKFVESRVYNAKNKINDVHERLENARANFQGYLEKYEETKELYEPILNKWKNFNVDSLLKRMRKLPFISSITFGYDSFTVKTLPLKLDCINFGAYDIKISKGGSQPFIFYEKQDKHQHPYDYYKSGLSGRDVKGKFCFGGYEEIMISAYRNLNFEQLILTCLKLLTNYQVSTRMHYIEQFLNSRNKRKISMILKDLAKEQKTSLRGFNKFSISSLLDGKLKFTAKKMVKHIEWGIMEDKKKEVEIKKCLKLTY